tara:strand:+ start:5908 stop:6429 length:522 start_codon:yes stop_codon:yes gene_type:complete
MSKIVSPIGVISFPAIFEPEINPNNPSAPAKYSTMIVFKPGTDISSIEALVEAAKIEKFGDKVPSNFRGPIRDGSEKSHLGGAFVEGAKFLTAKSKFVPGVVDANLGAIIDPSEVYPGVEARIQISAFAYSFNGNAGVSFSLSNLQKVRDGERLGNSNAAETAFDVVEVGDLL